MLEYLRAVQFNESELTRITQLYRYLVNRAAQPFCKDSQIGRQVTVGAPVEPSALDENGESSSRLGASSIMRSLSVSSYDQSFNRNLWSESDAMRLYATDAIGTIQLVSLNNQDIDLNPEK